MRTIGLAIVAWLALTAAAQAQDFGACAWGKLPASVRQSYLNAYHANMQDGVRILSNNPAAVRSAVASCTGRYDIPMPWVQELMTSAAVQEGAAAELAALNIPRTTLDIAWAQAPPMALQCARANAAKAFDIRGQTCPDPKAPVWFVQTLKLPAGDGPAVHNALDFYNAKAKDEWAEALIAKFKAQST